MSRLLAAHDEQIRLDHDIGREIPVRRFGQRTTDQLPWFHLITLITKFLRDQSDGEQS